MRILVLSDSHRNSTSVSKAVLQQPTAEVVIHLGDGADDLDFAKAEHVNKTFVSIGGNCDFDSHLPYKQMRTYADVKIFMTHGHSFNVKSSLCLLEDEARHENAEIALYGHTHKAKIEYKDGLYLMNPGALSGCPGTYGIIDLTPAGIVCSIIDLATGRREE